MKGIRFIAPVLAPLALAVSSVALAGGSGYEPPRSGYVPSMKQDFIVRAGGYYISAGDDKVSFVDDTFQNFDAFRSTVDPGSEWGWYFNFEWKPVEHLGFELGYMDGDPHTSSHADRLFSLGFEEFEYRDVVSFDADISTASLKFYPWMRPA